MQFPNKPISAFNFRPVEIFPTHLKTYLTSTNPSLSSHLISYCSHSERKNKIRSFFRSYLSISLRRPTASDGVFRGGTDPLSLRRRPRRRPEGATQVERKFDPSLFLVPETLQRQLRWLRRVLGIIALYIRAGRWNESRSWLKGQGGRPSRFSSTPGVL